MSRHRNVRSLNYEDEYYDDDDVYGHSVEDNYCISPGTAAQFTFNRDRHVELSNYMGEAEGIPEEDEFEENDALSPTDPHRNSLDYTRPKLNDLDNAKLNSCLEEVRNVLGESVPEHILIDTIMRHDFNLDSTLNELLNQQGAPKPQREKRENRRNRAQEFDNEFDPSLTHEIGPDNLYGDSEPDNVMSYVLPHLGGSMKFGPDSINEMGAIPSTSEDTSASSFNTNKTSAISSNITNTTHLTYDVDKTKSKAVKKQIIPKNNADDQTRNRSDILSSLSGLVESHNITRSSQTVAHNAEEQSNLNKREKLNHNSSRVVNKVPDSKVMSLVELSKVPDKGSQPLTSLSGEVNKTPATKGMSLADLAQVHGKDSKPVTSLSELAKMGKENRSDTKNIPGYIQSLADLGPATNKTPRSSLSDLSKQHSATTSKTGFSGSKQAKKPSESKQLDHQSKADSILLQDIVKEQDHNILVEREGTDTQKHVYSGPGTKHEKREQTLPQTEDLQHLVPSNNSIESKTADKGQNKEVNKTKNQTATVKDLSKGQNIPIQKGTSLAELSKVVGTDRHGQDQTASTNQKGVSLADLAKAHGVTNKQSSTSLSDLGKAQGIVKSDTGSGKAGIHSTQSFLTNQKGKDAQTAIHSLSSHLERFSTSDVCQQAAFGSGLRPSNKHPIKSTSNQPSLSSSEVGNKSEVEESSLVVKQQFVMVVKNNKPNHSQNLSGDKNERQSSNLTLADLAKQGQEIKGKVSIRTLSDRNTHSRQPGIQKTDTTTEKDTVPGTIVIERQSAIETGNSESSSVVDYDIDSTVIDDMLVLATEDSLHNIDHHVSPPSILGKIVCLQMHVTGKLHTAGKGYRDKRWKYKHQIKSTHMSMFIAKPVVPFDFNTPSPDDVIKSRQKLAFTRSGDRQ